MCNFGGAELIPCPSLGTTKTIIHLHYCCMLTLSHMTGVHPCMKYKQIHYARNIVGRKYNQYMVRINGIPIRQQIVNYFLGLFIFCDLTVKQVS